jgi:hypothetical protein
MKDQIFPSFFDVESLMENVQDAKAYLLKTYAAEKNIKAADLSDKEKKKILENPKYLLIKDLMEKNKMPGNTFPFLKFYMEQNAHIETLEEIIKNLQKYKNNLSELTMSISDYSKVVPTEDDPRPGYELLGDDLIVIERKRKLKDLYNELTPKMKKYFAKAKESQINDLAEISNQLKGLKDVTVTKGGIKVTKNAWKEFTKTFKKYDDTLTYKRYSDPAVAFGEISEDGLDFIKNWGTSDDVFIEKMKSFGAMAGILYQDPSYLVVSARHPSVHTYMGSAKNLPWCLKDPSQYWNYSAGRIQITIFNWDLPLTHIWSAVTVTINKDGTVHSDGDRTNSRLRTNNNSGFTGKNYKTVLEDLKYPPKLIRSVEDKFEREVDIKVALEAYYKEGDKLTPRKVMESLITISKGFLEGTMTVDDWERIAGIVSEVIFEDQNLSKSQFMDIFRKNGIYTKATWNVFDSLIGNDYTSKDIETIKDVTMDGIEQMEALLEYKKNHKVAMTQKTEDELERMIRERDDIENEFNKRL